MKHLVTHSWLNANLDDPDLVILDCTNLAAWSATRGIFRTTSGRDQWLAGNIKGSRHVDFAKPGLTGDATRFRNTLPEPKEFAAAMAGLGVHKGTRVVLYDNAASMWAARVWWMLRWIGFDRAAILDGGWGTGLPMVDELQIVSAPMLLSIWKLLRGRNCLSLVRMFWQL